MSEDARVPGLADLSIAAEKFFHEKIPLTRAMQLRVVATSGPGFAVEAPLTPNRNHLDTAFGGSVNAVATLAGYGLLWSVLQGQPAHIVIADSSIRFLRPIRGTIRALCADPGQAILGQFQRDVSGTGKGRVRLHVTVFDPEILAAEYRATFVALRNLGDMCV